MWHAYACVAILLFQRRQGRGLNLAQGCGIKGFIPTSVIQGNLPLYIWGVSLWEALFVVSQKWSFPTTLIWLLVIRFEA